MGLIGVRLAPGVRISVSSRGVRGHVGPRAMRVHAGAGRTGISTGAGPLSYYTAVGASTRRAAARPSTTSTPAQDDKAARAAALAVALRELQTRHAETFAPMTRPLAQVPAPVRGTTFGHHRARARAGVPWYDVLGRARASRVARQRATDDDRAALTRHEQERRDRQEELDAFWRRLTTNHPETVIAFLQEAFEDNADPAAVVGLHEDEAYLVVVAPRPDEVPDQIPGVTPTGRPSIRRMPAKDAAAYHRQMVAGAMLRTAGEAFAVSPGLASVKVAALSGEDPQSVVWSARLTRRRLERCHDPERTSLEVLECAADESHVRLVGAAQRLGPVDAAACGWSELLRALTDETWEGR